MRVFSNNVRVSAAIGTLALLILGAIGCGPGKTTPHPGQINTLDGDTYDSLTAARAAIATMRSKVQTSYPEYTAQYNQAAAAYGTAYASYVAFRSAPTSDQAQLAMVMQNLTVSVVALEDSFTLAMHADPHVAAARRKKAKQFKAQAKANGLSISDILTELEIAASIAATIPQAQPYAKLAELVLQATSAAVAELGAQDGMPIDLNLIKPMLPIAVK